MADNIPLVKKPSQTSKNTSIDKTSNSLAKHEIFHQEDNENSIAPLIQLEQSFDGASVENNSDLNQSKIGNNIFDVQDTSKEKNGRKNNDHRIAKETLKNELTV